MRADSGGEPRLTVTASSIVEPRSTAPCAPSASGGGSDLGARRAQPVDAQAPRQLADPRPDRVRRRAAGRGATYVRGEHVLEDVLGVGERRNARTAIECT